MRCCRPGSGAMRGLSGAPIERLVADIHPGETGRPPYWPLAMFKALLLQQWYGLSDPGLEEALLDRVSFRRFCGFALDAAIPDETTLCRFRNALKAAERGEALFAAIGAQLDASGFVLRKGTLIDATLVASAAAAPPSGSTPKGVESRSPHDHDANWTRQGHSRRLFFGYKASYRRRSRFGPDLQPLRNTGQDLKRGRRRTCHWRRTRRLRR
jgi:transposase, IS5 family